MFLHGGHGLSSVADPGSVAAPLLEGVVDEALQTVQKVRGLGMGEEAGLSAVEADVKAVVAPDTDIDRHAIDHGVDVLEDGGSALPLVRHLADFSLSLKRFATAERNLHVILTCEGWSKGCHPLAISLAPFYNGNLIRITK